MSLINDIEELVDGMLNKDPYILARIIWVITDLKLRDKFGDFEKIETTDLITQCILDKKGIVAPDFEFEVIPDKIKGCNNLFNTTDEELCDKLGLNINKEKK